MSEKEHAQSATAGPPSQGQEIRHAASSVLPTRHGEFQIHVYRPLDESVEHVALVMGDVRGREKVLVRVHSECLTGDAFGSLRCDCGEQLDTAMAMIAAAGVGAIIYLRGHEGRGIGLTNKIHAYKLQDEGRDTVQANLDLGLPVDLRDYQAAARIAADLGISSIRLLTNNPRKLALLEKDGLRIVERVGIVTEHTPHNAMYLRAKQEKLGHFLDIRKDVPKAE